MMAMESKRPRAGHEHHQERDHHDQESGEEGSARSGELANRTTDGQTMMHILKANIGTGVLAMPMAFRHVGLWLSLLLVPIIGGICIHCMNILIASHNKLCDRFNYESLDYDQVAALGLACGPKWSRRMAKWAHVVVTSFLMFTQIGFCCVYTLFTVENIQVAMFNLFKVDYSTNTYLLIVFPIIGLISCTSNLKHLARFSTLANVLQFSGLALIFFDLLQFNTFTSGQLVAPSASDYPLDVLADSISAAPLSGQQERQQEMAATSGEVYIKVEQSISMDILSGLPLFFATAVYAFEGIGVVLPLIKEMQYPARILGANGVLNTSMSLVALLYMAMGFFGYAKYGQLVAGSITLNLPETTLNELVRLAFATAIGLSYSLQFYVPWTILWPFIDETLFYSYRPRTHRDKLDILNKLSAENDWTLLEEEEDGGGGYGDEDGDRKEERKLLSATGCVSSPESGQEADDHDSNASTFATSYNSLSVMMKSSRSSLATSGHQLGSYGSLAAGHHHHHQLDSTRLAGARGRKRRNRLEDVMEQDLDEERLPEVQWRPPPRSMRGKRKLVRYSVILLMVAFTCK